MNPSSCKVLHKIITAKRKPSEERVNEKLFCTGAFLLYWREAWRGIKWRGRHAVNTLEKKLEHIQKLLTAWN